jgi:hypothetical protein
MGALHPLYCRCLAQEVGRGSPSAARHKVGLPPTWKRGKELCWRWKLTCQSSPTATNSDTLTTRKAMQRRGNRTNARSKPNKSYFVIFVPQAYPLVGTPQPHSTIQLLYIPIPGTAMGRSVRVRNCPAQLVMKTAAGYDGPRADSISVFSSTFLLFPFPFWCCPLRITLKPVF